MSHLESLLRAGAFPVALEITPPRVLGGRVLLRRARRLDGRPAAVNVIQRPDRVSSLESSGHLRARGVAPVWHLTSRGRGLAEIQRDVARARELGLREVLCLRGDHAAPDRPDTPRICEVVSLVRRELPETLVGVTLNQYLPHERVLRNLLPKLRAGARLVQTQPVFDLAPFQALVARVRAARPDVLVVPLLMPVLSREAASRLETRIGVRFAARELDRLEHCGAEAGWRAFAARLAEFYEGPLADGVALMTLELDPPDEFAARLEGALCEVLGAVPPENSSSTASRNAKCAGLL